MIPTLLMSEEVTVVHSERTGPGDEYNYPGDVVTQTVVRAWVEPFGRSREARNLRETGVADLTCFLDLDVDIDTSDRVEWRGDAYEVVGPPEPWVWGSLSHQAVNLRRAR